MKKINQFFSSHGIKVIVIFLTFLYFRGCGTNSELSKVKKELKIVQTEIDSLNNTVLTLPIITKDEMIYLIKTVPAWKTLRIEEISDKERISINALEEKED